MAVSKHIDLAIIVGTSTDISFTNAHCVVHRSHSKLKKIAALFCPIVLHIKLGSKIQSLSMKVMHPNYKAEFLTLSQVEKICVLIFLAG